MFHGKLKLMLWPPSSVICGATISLVPETFAELRVSIGFICAVATGSIAAAVSAKAAAGAGNKQAKTSVQAAIRRLISFEMSVIALFKTISRCR